MITLELYSHLTEDVNVIAWGLSLERPTMIKYHIDNIRDLVGHKVHNHVDMYHYNRRLGGLEHGAEQSLVSTGDGRHNRGEENSCCF